MLGDEREDAESRHVPRDVSFVDCQGAGVTVVDVNGAFGGADTEASADVGSREEDVHMNDSTLPHCTTQTAKCDLHLRPDSQSTAFHVVYPQSWPGAIQFKTISDSAWRRNCGTEWRFAGLP